MKRVLTPEQIIEARVLKEAGQTKRAIAYHFQVSPTTIWENVFSNTKRIRIYTGYIREKKIPCAACEILTTRRIKGKYIPLNFRIGDKCVGCFLEEKGFHYTDLLQIHD